MNHDRSAPKSAFFNALLEASSRLGGRAWTVERGYCLNLGCGWLHSAERNPWTRRAEAEDLEIDRRDAAWGTQYRDIGFSPDHQRQAHEALADWEKRLPEVARTSDCASDALNAGSVWNPYVGAMCGFSSGVTPERISAKDYLAYDAACSYRNWRLPAGLGTLISRSLTPGAAMYLSTPVQAVAEIDYGVRLTTPRGDIKARTAILTVATNILASDAIALPGELDPWREAAGHLPLGHAEKLFLQSDVTSFVEETHLLGDPSNSLACDFYIRPFGWSVIECYLGGDSALVVSEEGQIAGFTLAVEQLVALMGSRVRSKLKPLTGSDWGRADRIGGAYSCALPGRSLARHRLARSWKDKLFFAGEATSPEDFSTAHGAHASGERAADEVMAALGKHPGVAA